MQTGAVTGCVGGIIRDTLGHVPSVLLGHEIYVTASVVSAGTYVGLVGLGIGRLAEVFAALVVTFTVLSLATGTHDPESDRGTKWSDWRQPREQRSGRGTWDGKALTEVKEVFPSDDVDTEVSRIAFGRDGMLSDDRRPRHRTGSEPESSAAWKRLRRKPAPDARRWESAPG